jgi:hypothetical protein
MDAKYSDDAIYLFNMWLAEQKGEDVSKAMFPAAIEAERFVKAMNRADFESAWESLVGIMEMNLPSDYVPTITLGYESTSNRLRTLAQKLYAENRPFQSISAMCDDCLKIVLHKRGHAGHENLIVDSTDTKKIIGQKSAIITNYKCKNCYTKWEYEDDKNDFNAGWSNTKEKK